MGAHLDDSQCGTGVPSVIFTGETPMPRRALSHRRAPALFIFGLIILSVSSGLGQAAAVLSESPFAPVVSAAFAEANEKDTSKGNRVEMLSSGYDALLLRIHLIRNARRSIDVQTFIWSNDECGRMLMFELIEAARRGVQVRLIADQMFSDQDPEIAAFVATASPNLQIKHYRPTLSRIKPSLVHTVLASVESFHGVNQRMHSKIMLFDDAVLITGGRNLENGYYDHSTELNYRDRDVLAIGPVATDAAKEFQEFWTFKHSVASRDLSDVGAVIATGKFRRFERRDDYDFGSSYEQLSREADDRSLVENRFVSRLRVVSKARFLSDEPGKSRGFFSRTARITRELKATLGSARTSIVMQTPYLVLSNRAQELLRDLQQSHPGLRIRIATNSFASTDNILAYSGNYRLRNRYVHDLNLDVHEFKPEPASLRELLPRYDELVERARTRTQAGQQKRMPFLCVHAKSLVVDDRVAFIGSYNLDPRSERLNTEVGLLIEDETIARELRAEIERDMRPENSWVIAKRSMPLPVSAVNGLVAGILSLSPIDVWPIQNTSSFDLKPGGVDVLPNDPAFHVNFREVGAFPGTEGLFSTKEILTRLYKAVGPPLTPIL